MKVLNSLTLGAVGATDNLKLDNFPEGHQCVGLRLRCTAPITASSTHTGTAADLKNIIDHFLKSLTLSYGDGFKHVPYAAVPGAELRDVYRAMEEDEVQNGVVGFSYVNATAYTHKFDLFIPFRTTRCVGKQKLPGTTQMRSMKIEVVEDAGAIAGGGHSRTAAVNCTIDVIPVTIPGPDEWASVLSYGRINQAKL